SDPPRPGLPSGLLELQADRQHHALLEQVALALDLVPIDLAVDLDLDAVAEEAAAGFELEGPSVVLLDVTLELERVIAAVAVAPPELDRGVAVPLRDVLALRPVDRDLRPTVADPEARQLSVADVGRRA